MSIKHAETGGLVSGTYGSDWSLVLKIARQKLAKQKRPSKLVGVKLLSEPTN